MLGPRPSLWAMPSTWYADVAVPNTKPFGNLSLLSPPLSKLTLSALAHWNWITPTPTPTTTLITKNNRIVIAPLLIFNIHTQKERWCWDNEGITLNKVPPKDNLIMIKIWWQPHRGGQRVTYILWSYYTSILQ